MSNPSWCPACEESCIDQPDGICYTCGEELVNPPSSASQPSNSNTPDQHGNYDLTTNLLSDMGMNSMLPFVNQLRGATNNQESIADIASLLPPEALNPQSGSARHRPVSQRVLDDLKRIILTDSSAELFDACVTLYEGRGVTDISPVAGGDDKCLQLNAVPGEFGPRGDTKRNSSRTTGLIICSPRTTKGGLSSTTVAEIESFRQNRIPFLAYVERGDGITFVQKAISCQNAGQSMCIGVIVGNAGTAKEVWPYVMQDTTNEAVRLRLSIPVVMIRRADGNKLTQWVNKSKQHNDNMYTPCQLHVRSKEEHSCPVCADSYVAGATIVRLPTCGHVFHEKCAMMWLTKHNTCPYCRKELPTEDEEYEAERRRREAREGVGGGLEEGIGGNSFYG